ncbi:DEAD-box ATP-dependent RNA helicase 16 [Zea mays]|uniref:RNA helicase n=1 Tax=Zea mays TaxID=4577 RepID=A0A1D6GIC8_MAIZE|nr:DEAD-box ATP-dependent RNA helicase 16 [Zea mays]
MLYKLCLCYDCFYVYTIHLTAFVHILCCFYFDSIFNVCFICSINILMMNMLCFLQFGIRSAVLNAELPQNSRLHIIEAFNARLFDYLIATDDTKTKEKQTNEENKKEATLSRKRKKQTNKENQKEQKVSRKHLQQTLDAEFGVVRGIDFKNVFTVVNFDMPLDATGYVHRIGRTGRANKTGASISLVSPKEDSTFKEIEHMLQDVEKKDMDCISPFPLLTKDAVESLRYRAQVCNISILDYKFDLFSLFYISVSVHLCNLMLA